MLAWIGAVIGVASALILIIALGLMFVRPHRWREFIEKDRIFWIQCGIPTKWADTAREMERGWPLKVMILCDILVAVILTLSALGHLHGI